MRDQYKVLSEKYTQIFTEGIDEPPPNTAESLEWWSKSIKKFNLPDTDLFLQWLKSMDSFKYFKDAEGLGLDFFIGITEVTDSIIVALDFIWEMTKDELLREWKATEGLRRGSGISDIAIARINREATKQVIQRIYSEGFIPWKRQRDELYKDNPGVNIDI